MQATGAFVYEPDPENPGWHRWDLTDQTRFNPRVMGALRVRTEGERSARVRMLPGTIHSNLHDNVHGGVTMALIDIAMFATAYTVLGADAAGSVTLDCECRFIGAGTVGQPLDAVTEILRETGRLIFLRGLVEQEGTLVAAYSGTIRKPSRK